MFKRICSKLHLILGLITGVIVIIVCSTGALYIFKDEINDARSPWKFVDVPNGVEHKSRIYSGDMSKVKPLSEIVEISNSAIGMDNPIAVSVGCANEATRIDYSTKKGPQKFVCVNPYNGEVTKVHNATESDFDFFKFVIRGHRALWLPRDIGGPIVAYGVLIFFIVLVTGIVMWLPRAYDLKSLKSRLTFKRPFSPFRFMYDLHRTLGFYATIPLLIMCFTGMMFSISWLSDGVYNALSLGKGLEKSYVPKSVLADSLSTTASIDQLYTNLVESNPNAARIFIYMPRDEQSAYKVNVSHKRNSYYRTDFLYFDQYTLKPLESRGVFSGKYTEANAAHKLRRMNLELHDGRILGLGGKIVMFLACLVGISLPITGFVIWRKKESAKKKARKSKEKQ
ncbi:MAG: PepSY-associated TM helix domain-containing protein [Bacteroides sp.]|nr:PepSY-associated TM helix domain-containing protein [Bacteroides sp.]